jgi:hypothetical protein
VGQMEAWRGETKGDMSQGVEQRCFGCLYIGRGWLAEASREDQRRRLVVLHQSFSYSKGRRQGGHLMMGKQRGVDGVPFPLIVLDGGRGTVARGAEAR